MVPKNKSKANDNDGRIVKKSHVRWISGMVALIFIGGYAFLSVWITQKNHGMEDLFDFLERQGYVINRGFSGVYQPGTIIQVTELVGKEERALPMPILVLSKSRCFPQKAPTHHPFTLPNMRGTSAASLKAGDEFVHKFFPDLTLYSNTVASYSLQLGDIYTATFARLDLSRSFSDQCVDDLRNALVDGDKIDWFKVITEAVIADSFRFEISWKDGSSINAQNAVKNAILEIMLRNNENRQTSGYDVALESDKEMIIQAKGPVILGYKFRPLGIVY